MTALIGAKQIMKNLEFCMIFEMLYSKLSE